MSALAAALAAALVIAGRAKEAAEAAEAAASLGVYFWLVTWPPASRSRLGQGERRERRGLLALGPMGRQAAIVTFPGPVLNSLHMAAAAATVGRSTAMVLAAEAAAGPLAWERLGRTTQAAMVAALYLLEVRRGILLPVAALREGHSLTMGAMQSMAAVAALVAVFSTVPAAMAGVRSTAAAAAVRERPQPMLVETVERGVPTLSRVAVVGVLPVLLGQ